MMLDKSEKKLAAGANISARATTGMLMLPIKIISVIGSLFLVWAILLLALFLAKFINANAAAFQDKLQNDEDFNGSILALVNTILGLFNLGQQVAYIAIEIWNYCVPALNLAAYIFYRIAIAVLLSMFGAGVPQQNDSGDAPLGSPDPVGAISGDTETFLSLLECVVIDLLTLGAGVFKVFIRAVGACMMVVFEWLTENLQNVWYRQEYCRRGASGTSANWGSFGDDPDSGRTVYDNGTGPGATCPDNSVIIQGVIRIVEMIINITRDIFIIIFPIIADMWKMFFDALLKILPYLMEAIVWIIEIFDPSKPLGKFLMYCLNFMIQILGFILRSCVLQLIIAIVTCLFNVGVATLANALRKAAKTIAKGVCLGGKVCKPKIPGKNLKVGSCSWKAFVSCVATTYDNQQRNVTSICQVPTCSKMVSQEYKRNHDRMVGLAQKQQISKSEYSTEYHKSCVDIYTNNRSRDGDDTVQAHLFCRYLSETAHAEIPLGIDPSEYKHPLADGGDFCQDVRQTCLCKYNSAICESQTCCLSMYTVLVQQIIQEIGMETCDLWQKKKDFAQIYCISKTQRSLDLGLGDVMGTVTHCDGFVSLMEDACGNAKPGQKIDVNGIVGGMCNWVDHAGFCDSFRRPTHTKAVETVDQVIEIYNKHMEELEYGHRYARMGYNEGRTPVRETYKTRLRDKTRSAMGHNLTAFAPEKLPRRSWHPSTDMRHYGSYITESFKEIQDTYDVTMFLATNAFPALYSMLITPSYANVLGQGVSGVKRDSEFLDHLGDYRSVRVQKNDKWMDVEEDETVSSVRLDGSPLDFMVLGSVPASPYVSGCTSTSVTGAMTETKARCMTNRIKTTSAQTGSTIDTIVAPGQAQDQIDNMITHGSQPIYTKTTNRTSFSRPTSKYKTYAEDYDMPNPSVWTADDAERDNINANWRQPLTRKNSTSGRKNPGGFIIYARPEPNENIPMEECPIPTEFPWQKVFAKRSNMFAPIAAVFKKIPEWTDESMENVTNIDIPPHIRDGVKLMYSRRQNRMDQDIKRISKIWRGALEGAYEVKKNWDVLRATRTERNTTSIRESWWSKSLVGFSDGRDPSSHNILGATANTTDLCVNALLSPYQCCTDTASAYECCFGLLGCIPPISFLNVTKVDNLDAIATAQCNGAGNILMSFFFLPRYIFGAWIWTFIWLSPPWVRRLEFRILYPLIYDYGGAGQTSSTFVADMFCFIVNLYWFILVALIILGLYIFDTVFLAFFKELITETEIAATSLEVTQTKEYAQAHIGNLEKQLKELGKNQAKNKHSALGALEASGYVKYEDLQ